MLIICIHFNSLIPKFDGAKIIIFSGIPTNRYKFFKRKLQFIHYRNRERNNKKKNYPLIII